MAVSGKGVEGLDTGARAMTAEFAARVTRPRDTTPSEPVEEPEQPPAPRDP